MGAQKSKHQDKEHKKGVIRILKKQKMLPKKQREYKRSKENKIESAMEFQGELGRNPEQYLN